MEPSRSRPSLGVSIGIVSTGLGAIFGAGALSDNSFLTHLATGRLIWDGAGIPRNDPYSFTAAGDPWVVQSWFASLLYGAVEQAAGLAGLRVLMALTTAALGYLTWTLTRQAVSLPGRLVVWAPAFFAGAMSWTERPLLLGLVALGVTLVAADDRLDVRWLLPVGWLWVNVHGSWPLGLVALACLATGRRLDGASPATELRALRWLALGFAAAAMNPYGPRLLVFPLELLSRRESLAGIVEWGSMTFAEPEEWALLMLVVVGIVAVHRRPSWRSTLPLVVFSAAAFTGLRNLPVAALVLLPGAASGMADLGTILSDRPSPLARPVALLGVVLGLLAVVSISQTDDFDDQPFPVAAEAWLRQHDLSPTSHRIVAREFVGNWLEAVHGPTQEVFMDDRIEVMPADVVADHRRLLRGSPRWESILERYGAEAVLWEADSPLAAILEAAETWDVAYRDDTWIVAVPSA